MIIFYFLSLIGLTIYSFALVDPNFTLINSPIWTSFRDLMIGLGYFQRYWSWIIYLIIIFLLFLFHYFFIKKYKNYSAFFLSIGIGLITLFSYPFLSHDFFNYIFDAKILTFYHLNPYLYKALDFPQDHWIRFMHWTHRPYPYGPTFLPITLIPSFLGMGKFVLHFFFFKALFIGLYIATVYQLNTKNKKWAMIFATNPLIIIEGLVNAHNDIVVITLALIGICLMLSKKKLLSIVLFILSAGIKYTTIPLIFLSEKNKKQNYLVFFGVLALLLVLVFTRDIQQWYFLTLFVFLPYYEDILMKLNIFFGGLLLSYYPYIRLGGWDSIEKINLKHIIILIFLIVNIIFILKDRKSIKLVYKEP